MNDPGIFSEDVNGGSVDIDDTKTSTLTAMSPNTTETIMMTTPKFSLEKANLLYKKIAEDFRLVQNRLCMKLFAIFSKLLNFSLWVGEIFRKPSFGRYSLFARVHIFIYIAKFV